LGWLAYTLILPPVGAGITQLAQIMKPVFVGD
jgi:hypothetical protein